MEHTVHKLSATFIVQITALFSFILQVTLRQFYNGKDDCPQYVFASIQDASGLIHFCFISGVYVGQKASTGTLLRLSIF